MLVTVCIRADTEPPEVGFYTFHGCVLIVSPTAFTVDQAIV